MMRAMLGAVAFAAAVGAQAQTLCSAPGAHPEGLDVSDMTFRSNSADDCYGVVTAGSGNPTSAGINAIGWGTGYVLAAKSDDASAGSLIGGFDFSITANPSGGATSGSWTVTLTDPPPANSLPVTFDLIGVIKASDRHAAYFFDDEVFNALGAVGPTGNSWEVSYQNAGGRIPNISHLELWARVVSGGGPPGGNLPEPGTLALLGLAVVGARAASRRVAAKA